jgi:hypothetical protein
MLVQLTLAAVAAVVARKSRLESGMNPLLEIKVKVKEMMSQEASF